MVFFILSVKAMYFIWVYFLMVCASERVVYAVSGVVIGHLYIYFKEILPITHRKYFLDTPRFINRFSDWFLKIMGENNERNMGNRPNNN